MMNLGAMSEAVAMASRVDWRDSVFSDWGQGGVELFHAVGQLAQTSSDLVEDIIANTSAGIPGVWAYEVSEEMGSWITPAMSKYQGDFDVNLAKVKLGEIAYDFFARYPEELPVVMPFITKHTNFVK